MRSGNLDMKAKEPGSCLQMLIQAAALPRASLSGPPETRSGDTPMRKTGGAVHLPRPPDANARLRRLCPPGGPQGSLTTVQLFGADRGHRASLDVSRVFTGGRRLRVPRLGVGFQQIRQPQDFTVAVKRVGVQSPDKRKTARCAVEQLRPTAHGPGPQTAGGGAAHRTDSSVQAGGWHPSTEGGWKGEPRRPAPHSGGPTWLPSACSFWHFLCCSLFSLKHGGAPPSSPQCHF